MYDHSCNLIAFRETILNMGMGILLYVKYSYINALLLLWHRKCKKE